MAATTEATVGARDDVLGSNHGRVALDALRHDLRMFYHVRRVRDDARDEDLAIWQLGVLPDDPFVLVAGVRAFDQVALRVDHEHYVDELLELDVEGVRAVPATPAEVIAHAVLRQPFEGVVQRFYARNHVLSEGVQAHVDADTVP